MVPSAERSEVEINEMVIDYKRMRTERNDSELVVWLRCERSELFFGGTGNLAKPALEALMRDQRHMAAWKRKKKGSSVANATHKYGTGKRESKIEQRSYREFCISTNECSERRRLTQWLRARRSNSQK